MVRNLKPPDPLCARWEKRIAALRSGSIDTRHDNKMRTMRYTIPRYTYLAVALILTFAWLRLLTGHLDDELLRRACRGLPSNHLSIIVHCCCQHAHHPPRSAHVGTSRLRILRCAPCPHDVVYRIISHSCTGLPSARRRLRPRRVSSRPVETKPR